MEKESVIQKLFKPVTDHAQVGMIFGEPQKMKNKTVIPVARVFWMFGGGMGVNEGLTDLANGDDSIPQGEGGGGGGILSAEPIGALEITPDRTRLVPFKPWWQKLIPVLAGLIFSVFIIKLLGKR